MNDWSPGMTAHAPGAAPAARGVEAAPGETLQKWKRRPRNLALALGIVLAAGALRLVLMRWLPGSLIFLTFYPAVLVTTTIAGLEAGVVALGLSLVLASWMFVTPGQAFAFDSDSVIKLVAFIGVSLIAIAVVNRLEQLTVRLSREIERSGALAGRHAAAAVAAWESRERLDTLIAQVPVGIIEFDLAGRLTLANEHAATLLGRPVMEMIGMRWLDLVRPDERHMIGVAIDALIAHGRAGTLLTVVDLPGGTSRTLRSHFGLARDPEGRPQAVLNALEAVEHAI